MTLSSKDRALVAAAEATIRRHHVPAWQHLGAALRAKSGRVYTAVNLKAYVSPCDVCAEQIALGKAFSEGERQFDTIVTVRWVGRGRAHVVSPCGICRELLSDYGDPWVIHRKGQALSKTRASRLLPQRYDRPGEARSTPRVRENGRRSRGA